MQAVLDYPKITVISPQGCLNAKNALEFETNLTKALAQDGISILLVNLEYVESLDSKGLMALVSALKLAQKLGRRFSLCTVPPSLKIIFELTQLDQIFEIFQGQAAFEAACLSTEDATLTYA
ncbi:STAS domain-containing protein [Mastigocladopsis repens]|uniref:STAS domain-containing protein n=1 Tax=Mastigocladopsis repens TaxID=221287 RepID=UPI00030B09F4|nr:STAS domain-containing protein [Mastigocladopsis repens]